MDKSLPSFGDLKWYFNWIDSEIGWNELYLAYLLVAQWITLFWSKRPSMDLFSVVETVLCR
uniref:Uncharacterized protein n=1 Tax=Tetranychus urticae TaxID=32264 RepID=T1KAN0_TETUR